MTEQNELSEDSVMASISDLMMEDDDEPIQDSADAEPQEEERKLASVQERTAPAPNDVSQSPVDEKTVIVQKDEPVAPEIEKTEAVLSVADETEQAQEDDVLNLTSEMIVDEQPSKTEPVIKTQKTEETAKLEEEEEDDFTPEPVIPAEPMKEETLTDLMKENIAMSLEEGDGVLLSEPAVAAAAESLSHLRDIAVGKQLSLGQGNLTIEAIVRETLKPYLKEWLDINLPEIVERVVKKEVAHIMDRLDLK